MIRKRWCIQLSFIISMLCVGSEARSANQEEERKCEVPLADLREQQFGEWLCSVPLPLFQQIMKYTYSEQGPSTIYDQRTAWLFPYILCNDAQMVALSDDGHSLATKHTGKISVWDPKTLALLRTTEDKEDVATLPIGFQRPSFADGDKFLMVADDGTVNIYDAKTRAYIRRFAIDGKDKHVMIGLKGQYLVTRACAGKGSGAVHIWKPKESRFGPRIVAAVTRARQAYVAQQETKRRKLLKK
ncbi:MAG TPA: WD40 repeat domain-containing protein [Candidatus Babeliales bacterium]|nr:WD40 repeat domain-containing protein [Candidatus Babeliales bacterium]